MQVLAQPGDYVLYTDGGCHNAGSKLGAFYYVCIKLDHAPPQVDHKHGLLVLSGGEVVTNTTNNVMEMTAILKGLERCTRRGIQLRAIITDSQYVQKGMTLWSNTWKRNGWRNSFGKLIHNLEIWQELLNAWNREKTQVIHIRGHSGVFWNEFCDSSATEIMQQYKASVGTR